MHTIVVMASGLALLVICLVLGRFVGVAPTPGMAKGALWFIPLWLIAAAANLYVGVSRAGYSVADETPIFLLIFSVPAIVAIVIWWRLKQR